MGPRIPKALSLSVQTTLVALEQDNDLPTLSNQDAVYIAYGGPWATRDRRSQRPN